MICLAGAVSYFSTVNAHKSWQVYVLASSIICWILFTVGALSRSKVRSRGGENLLDSLDMETPGFSQVISTFVFCCDLSDAGRF